MVDTALPDRTSCNAFEHAFSSHNVGTATFHGFDGFLVNDSWFEKRLSPTVGCTLVRVIRGCLAKNIIDAQPFRLAVQRCVRRFERFTSRSALVRLISHKLSGDVEDKKHSHNLFL